MDKQSNEQLFQTHSSTASVSLEFIGLLIQAPATVYAKVRLVTRSPNMPSFEYYVVAWHICDYKIVD